jgi:hypothetical protein
MHEFDTIAKELTTLINEWENKLLLLDEDVIANHRNGQSRTIRQILGHLVDSASNNIHRIIHLQYQPIPLVFPDYANLGANDVWIGLQNYQEEDWQTLVQLWKYLNRHFIHVMLNINEEALGNVWISALGQEISLRAMVVDYPRHFKLHLAEIRELAEM